MSATIRILPNQSTRDTLQKQGPCAISNTNNLFGVSAIEPLTATHTVDYSQKTNILPVWETAPHNFSKRKSFIESGHWVHNDIKNSGVFLKEINIDR